MVILPLPSLIYVFKHLFPYHDQALAHFVLTTFTYEETEPLKMAELGFDPKRPGSWYCPK